MMKDMPESHWPIGRVLETHGGSNDVVCVVKLNTNDRAKWLDHLPKRLAWSQSQLIIGSYSLNGEGGRDIICNCNTANIDIVVLFLSEQLSNNIYYTLEKLMFQLVYIFFCLPFSCQSEEKFVKCTNSLMVKFFILMTVQGLVNPYY